MRTIVTSLFAGLLLIATPVTANAFYAVGEHRANGDQTHQGRHVRLPLEQWSIQKFKLYRYS